MIVQAIISDAEELTEIALKSKAYWGYADIQIESWREDLTVSKEMVEEMYVYKFLYAETSEEKIAGFYILNQPKNKTIELEFLFVNPTFIGKGIGKQLLEHSFFKMKELGAKSMILLADPNAVPFYSSQGFYKVDEKESTISGRFLPILKRDL
jgi:N-acetylglutamate synthase-like GNAT family acetyltransferase